MVDERTVCFQTPEARSSRDLKLTGAVFQLSWGLTFQYLQFYPASALRDPLEIMDSPDRLQDGGHD